MNDPAKLFLVVCRCKTQNSKLTNYLNANPNASLTATTWLVQSFRTIDFLEEELRKLATPEDAFFIQRVTDDAKSLGFESESNLILKGICSKALTV